MQVFRHLLRQSARVGCCALTVSTLVLATPASAEAWTSGHGPYFASMQGVTVGSAGSCGAALHAGPAAQRAVYAAVDSGVWVRCGSHGEWRALGAVIWASSVAVDPSDDRKLYVSGSSFALGTGLLRSHDGGATWQAPQAGLPFAWYNTVKVLATRRPIVLAAGVGGVYRSTDGGANWQPAAGIAPTEYVGSLAVDPATPNLVFAAGGGGIYRSRDGGANWARLSGGLPEFPFGQSVSVQATRHGAAVYATLDGSVWRSLDRGDNWAKADGFGLPDSYVVAVAIDASPRSPAVLYGMLFDWTLGQWAVYRSGDGGGTWSSAGPSLAPNDTMQAIVADLSAPGTVYLSSQITGLQVSRDGGSTWTSGSPRLIGEVGRVAVAPSAPQVLYAGSYASGPFRSDDGGRSWTRINAGLYGNTLGVQALAVSPVNPATAYIGTCCGVFATTDAGANWSWTNGGMPEWNPQVQALAIAAQQPGTVYAGTVGSGVYKSVDGGTWTPTALASGNVYSIAIDPTRPSTVYASLYEGGEGPPDTRGGLGVFKTVDGGGHWIPVNNGLGNLIVRTLAVDPTHPTTVYAGTNGSGLYKSVDGGQTWAASATGFAGRYPSSIAFAPRDGSTVYAATYDAGVFRSSDGGAHWLPMNRGLDVPTTSAQALAVDPVTGRRLYLGTYLSGVAVQSGGPD